MTFRNHTDLRRLSWSQLFKFACELREFSVEQLTTYLRQVKTIGDETRRAERASDLNATVSHIERRYNGLVRITLDVHETDFLRQAEDYALGARAILHPPHAIQLEDATPANAVPTP